ncbi:50S ribosomal protein L1 [Nanoarchaeota archaeon]
MDKKNIIEALAKIKESSKKRNFTQSIDLVINLKELNLKKNDEQVNVFMDLPHETGKKVKLCALVGNENVERAKKEFDLVIGESEFAQYQEKKKEFKKIAQQHKFFIAQATIMPKVAKSFGRVLGTKGKLPNPKAGCVVPPNADFSVLKKKLSKTIKLVAKTELSIKCPIGNEGMSEDHVADNAVAVYNKVKSALPREENNIKNMIIKTTMGVPVKVEIKRK